VTLRQGLLRAARRSPKLLGDATERVTAFVRSLACPDGGFRGRAEASDLYYTVFALDALDALTGRHPQAGLEGVEAAETCLHPQSPLEGGARRVLDRSDGSISQYLDSFGDGEGLDLVHVACLARCWAHADVCPCRAGLLSRVDALRAQEADSAYSLFLAAGAREDLGAAAPDGVADSLLALRAADGGFANVQGGAVGSTPATAAAVTLLRHLGHAVDPAAGDWLLARREAGGFKASPGAPIPDLLSTATSLYALAALGRPLDDMREACLDFLDARWDPVGGFGGSALDPAVDAEYTFYGLLALGHLAT